MNSSLKRLFEIRESLSLILPFLEAVFPTCEMAVS